MGLNNKGLTDEELRAAPVPFSGDVTVTSAVLPTGAATEATLATRATETTLTSRASESTLATRASESTLATRATEATLATRASESTLASRVSESNFDSKIGAITETAPGTDTASSGLNGRLQRIAQRITSLLGVVATEATLATRATEATLATRASETTLATRATEATLATRASESTLATRATEATLSTRLSESDFDTKVGATNEAAPGTDTATSGLNGRLQRIAQRLTTLIGLLPASLGQKVSSGSFAVVLASDQSATSLNNQSVGAHNAAVPSHVTMIGADDETNSRRLQGRIGVPLATTYGLVVRPLPFERQTFQVSAQNVAIGNGKSMCSLFNATGSGVVIRVVSIRIYSVQTTAVTGVMANFGLRKISAHSGGIQLTTTGAAAGLIFPFDSTNALNGLVTARTGATVTENPAFNISQWLWSSDEFGTGTADAETFEHSIAQSILAWGAVSNAQPIVLRPKEGVHILQSTNSTAGTFNIVITFTQDTA